MMQSDDKQNSIIIEPKPAVLLISPYAMAKFSSDLHNLMVSFGSEITYPATKYFILCLSIELAIKSSLKNAGYNNNQLKELGHNLGKLVNTFNKVVAEDIFNKEDVKAIGLMTRYYDGESTDRKSIVYAGPSLLEQMLKGYSDLPTIEDLQNASIKLEAFLKSKNYFN